MLSLALFIELFVCCSHCPCCSDPASFFVLPINRSAPLSECARVGWFVGGWLAREKHACMHCQPASLDWR